MVQCQLEVSYLKISEEKGFEKITENFDLPMLSSRTLGNGVTLYNPSSCDSTTLDLIFNDDKSEPLACTDSDGGKNYDTVGQVYLTGDDVVYRDSCVGDSAGVYLQEYYCKGNNSALTVIPPSLGVSL